MSSSVCDILYVAEFTTGGSVESLHSLVTGLDKSRFRPTVVFYSEPAGDIRARFEEAGAAVVTLSDDEESGASTGITRRMGMQARVRRLLGRHAESAYATFKYFYLFSRYRLPVFFALRREMKRRPVDLVHLNNGLASDTVGILAAASCRLPVVCHVRAFAIHAPPQVRASRFVSAFLCVSKAIREHLVEAGVDRDKTRICYDSVNQARFRPTGVDRAARLASLGIDAASHVFGLIGRLDLWKGHPDFIEAIGIARQSNPDIVGLIVGGGADSERHRQYVDGLHRKVEELDLGSAIVFEGHRTDVPEIIESLDAVVCASSSPEPFGLMVVEAMAMGTPVIATNAGGPAEMITDGVDGLLVPPGDPQAMAQAMLHIAENPEAAAAFVEAGSGTVESRFTVAHHVANVSEIYGDVLGTDREPPAARKTDDNEPAAAK